MENAAIVTGIISLINPFIMDIFRFYISSKFLDEKVSKAVQFLGSCVLGILMTVLINFLFGYNLTANEILFIGFGISQTVGEFTYRFREVIKKEK